MKNKYHNFGTKAEKLHPSIDWAKNRVCYIYKQATHDEIIAGRRWYQDASDSIDALCLCFPAYTRLAVCCVVAALSPRNRWEYNLADTYLLLYCHNKGLEMPSTHTFHRNTRKAWDILCNPDVDPCSYLSGQKVESFRICLYLAGDCRNVCIDTHAINILRDEKPKAVKQRSIGKKEYKAAQDAYNRAGKTVGLSGPQIQAITWLAWKRIHGV